MAIVVKLTGDLSDLEAKLKSAGVKVESFGDSAEAAGKQASGAFSGDLESKIQRIEEATKRSADATETLASHAGGMNALAEGFGNTERLALGMNDIMGVAAEQFGVSLGPAQEYAQAIGDVAGGLEGVIGGGVALVQQIAPMVTGMVPLIASTWAHVTALYAQAAAFIAANAPMIAIIATVALVAAGVLLLIKHWDDITAKFPILGEATDAIKAKLGEFGAWITQTFIPAVASLYDPAVKVPLELIVSYFKLQFDLVRVGIETVLGVIKGIVDIFMGVFTGDWDRAWGGVKEVVDSLWTGIKEAFNLGMEFFTNLVPKLKTAGEKLGGALMDGLKSALGAVAGFAGGVADAVLSAVQGVVNRFVIDPINRTLEFSFDTHIPGVGKININPPDLPRLATGMWNVPGPTGVDQFPALLAGGEMVLPAREAEAFRVAFGAAGDGTGGDGDMTADQRVFVEKAMETWVQLLPDEIKRAVMAAYGSFAAGNLPLVNMLRILENYMGSVPDIGTPSVYPTGPHPERGGGAGTGVPVATGAPRPGDAGGTANGGGAPRATLPGGGTPASDETMAAVLEELKKANILAAKQNDILKEPQLVDFMSRGDPKSLAALLAPFLADSLAQIYRRQWSP